MSEVTEPELKSGYEKTEQDSCLKENVLWQRPIGSFSPKSDCEFLFQNLPPTINGMDHATNSWQKSASDGCSELNLIEKNKQRYTRCKTKGDEIWVDQAQGLFSIRHFHKPTKTHAAKIFEKKRCILPFDYMFHNHISLLPWGFFDLRQVKS